MIIICFAVFILYGFLILQLYVGFNQIPMFESKNQKPTTQFSIIVPFRNEARNLKNLIACLDKLNYLHVDFEVILVDDASDKLYALEENTIDIQIIKNIRKSNSPKKDAIETAIQVAKFPWIVTTDADCLVGENWLTILDQFIQFQKAEMVVGAVKYTSNRSFLQQFQSLDMASLQGVTIGSFGISKRFMCNGANFAYTKNIFNKLNGFDGNNHIASGDDVFLLQKAQLQYPEKVGYLKATEHIVTTKPVDSWKNLFFQRVRWASKTAAYKDYYPKFLGLIVFATNLLSCYLLILLFVNFQITFLILLLCKFTIDAMIIYKTNRFLQSKTNFLLLGSLCYPFFSVGVALYSIFGKYEWKGRKF